jgi:hypothetical protein
MAQMRAPSGRTVSARAKHTINQAPSSTTSAARPKTAKTTQILDRSLVSSGKRSSRGMSIPLVRAMLTVVTADAEEVAIVDEHMVVIAAIGAATEALEGEVVLVLALMAALGFLLLRPRCLRCCHRMIGAIRLSGAAAATTKDAP